MNTNLELIVKESGLEKTKADYILQKFTDYFRIAAEWETRAQTICVTNETQIVDMQMARTGRLFLREKRIAIENSRKELKEQALREGKAIDGIANVLKALIVPIEDYLDRQEHYVEIKAAEKAEAERIAAEAQAEADRIAKEKADAEERERQRIENILLKEEAERREKIIQEQKAKAEAERKAHEETLRKEREKVEAERKIAAAKAEAEKKAHEEILEAERRKREAEVEKAKAKQAELKKKIEIEKKKLITCPFCKKQFRSES